MNEQRDSKPRAREKQAPKNTAGPKRRHGHPKKPAPATKSSGKSASDPQPPEISPTIFEKLTTTQKRALEKFLNRHKPILDELTPERIEELLSQARQEQKPDPAAQFEEAKLDAIDQEIWKPFRDRVANRVLAAKERKQQGADLADLVRDFTWAYSGCICEVVADYADLMAQRAIASGKRITVERRDELVQDALSFGRNFVDWYMVGPWFEMVIGEIPSELENHIVEALTEDEHQWKEEASRRIALRAAISPLPVPRLVPELVPGVQIPLETWEKKESLLPSEATNILAVRNESTLRRWARQGKLDRTDAGRIVVNEKFKALHKQRHSPATRKNSPPEVQ